MPQDDRIPAQPDGLSALTGFDTPTLFEALGPAHAAALGSAIATVVPGQRVAGPALTVACPPGDNLMIHAAVADAAPGEVLVVQCHDASYGVWGEVLMTAARARGIAGLVIDGGVRDVEAMRAAGFPVFARAISIRGAAKAQPGLLRQPISCGGTLVWPGDIVVADDNGVIAIPADKVEQVLALARERQQKEARIMEQLGQQRTTVELLGLAEALDANSRANVQEGRRR